ncbi:MAG: DinB family protein [Candidatus Hermodarchaeota archaeon]
MSQLENIKQQLNYALNFAMKTLDKAILRIPDDKLDFKPIDTLMSIGELASHIYMCALVYTAGTLKGDFTDNDYSIIPFDYKNVKSAAEIIEYGKKVKAYIQETLEKFTEADMQKEVYNPWGGVKIPGFASMSTILEEVIHHRGQICVYLRLLGIEPPFIYDFS